ncbi:MAG: hypothetical protein ACI4S2_04215 [Lachnospiraceae bacterium]
MELGVIFGALKSISDAVVLLVGLEKAFEEIMYKLNDASNGAFVDTLNDVVNKLREDINNLKDSCNQVKDKAQEKYDEYIAQDEESAQDLGSSNV